MKKQSSQHKKNQNSFPVRILAVSLAVGMFAGMTLGCGRQGSSGEEKELWEPVGTAIDTDVASLRDVCVMECENAAVILKSEDMSFPVSGKFIQYYAFPGDTVKEGDILAEISQESLVSDIEALETRIKEQTERNASENQMTEIDLAITALGLDGLEGDMLAMKTLEYQKALVQYRQKVERQQMEQDYMNLQLAKQTEQLGETIITAPCDGIITAEVNHVFGDSIGEGEPVLSVASTMEENLMVTTSYVSQKDMKDFADCYAVINGARVEINYVEYDKKELSELILSGAELKSYFTLENGENISAGDYAKICYVKEQSLQTLAVVSNAVYRDGTGYYVYLIGENDVKVRQAVEVGVKNETYTEILSGLQEGDRVYVQN